MHPCNLQKRKKKVSTVSIDILNPLLQSYTDKPLMKLFNQIKKKKIWNKKIGIKPQVNNNNNVPL